MSNSMDRTLCLVHFFLYRGKLLKKFFEGNIVNSKEDKKCQFLLDQELH